MLISASRRTDIPAHYSEWFWNRLQEGYALVRNPVNPHQVSRVCLAPDQVDGIVFWTKNPIPMLEQLDRLRGYLYCFQFTVTSYGADVEPGVPSKSRQIIPAFQRLSDRIGPERVIWRYDPILYSSTYTMDYHIRYFAELAKRLAPYTKKCTISFLDVYRKIAKRMAEQGIWAPSAVEQRALAKELSAIAHSYGLPVETCAEEIDLQAYGIGHGHCIDGSLWEKWLGRPLRGGKDKNQRLACGCVESVEIGAYDTCPNGCCYCYASTDAAAAAARRAGHDPHSPLLWGKLEPEDRVTERKGNRSLAGQLTF